MKKMLALVALAAVEAAYGLPSVRPAQALPGLESPKVPNGPLDGWEVQLKTDSELATCVNPVVVARLRVIRCDGIKTLTLLSDLPGAQED